MSERDPLVSATWLKDHLEAPDSVVLDATWVPPFLKDRPNGKACYQNGHIPGAQYFDIDDIADTASGLKHMLPSADVFAAKIGALGVSNTTRVIVYDSNSFFASARAWWMFRAMGHDEVYALDGGLSAWETAGGALQTEQDTPTRQTFTATYRADLVRNQSAMRAHVDKADVKILDARAQGRFDGTSPEPRADLPSGHMPGSYCVPATALLSDSGAMLSKSDLEPILEPFLDSPVVTSCGSGVSAAVISLALARAGNWDAALYDGSWSEWAANSDNPIATAS
ncbi:MAG: 3-mercaptopyruvate sulfurtransferase [Henriciella sp.]